MKILGICCSPRKGGNTEILLNEALSGAKQEGSEVELFSVSGKHIEPCDGCRTCVKIGECHIKDDMQDLYDKMAEADGIIYGTPVYRYTMISQAKIILDRSLAVDYPGDDPGNRTRSIANKVAGVVAVAGSLGLVEVVKDLYFYIVTRSMLPANYVAAYALDKGDVRKRIEGMKASYNLGRQIVHLANMKFEYPKEFRRPPIAYGTWKQ
jgi:multimeric flavodoxin WrbA